MPQVKVHIKGQISIHSLRVEGDGGLCLGVPCIKYFNPLPPCGGRHDFVAKPKVGFDFNPLPPCGGRPVRSSSAAHGSYFNPLPPCGGRPEHLLLLF